MKKLTLKLPIETIYANGALNASDYNVQLHIKSLAHFIGKQNKIEQFIQDNELKIGDTIEVTIKKL